MPESAIGLMARQPQLGRVKTRLAQTIGEAGSLDVYRQLLAQANEVLMSLNPNDIIRAAFITPAEARQEFADNYPGLDLYSHQEGTDLGLRMKHAFEKLLALDGIRRACLIGADAPELKSTSIEVAFDFLEDHDLVLGPSLDGGYYLIGLRRMTTEILDGINWGTDTVLESTLRRAERVGLQVAMLPKLRDLDDAADLEYFVQTSHIQKTWQQDLNDK